MSEQFLHGIETLTVQSGSRPVQTVRSSVIGLIGTAGKGLVNQPVLIIGNRQEAVAAFGRFRNDGFTIPRALDAIFNQVGALVVVVNVLDASDEDNQEDVANEAVRLSNNVANLANGFVVGPLAFNAGTSFARQTLTLTGLPATTGTVTIGTKTYTYKTALSTGPAVANEVLIGANVAATIANLIAAVNGADGQGTTYGTGTTASTQVVGQAGPAGKAIFVAITAGTGSNAIATTATATNQTFGGVTLTGGATGTLLNAPYILQADGTIALPSGANLVRVENADGDEISYGDLLAGDSVVVFYVATLVEDTDYTVNREDGTITRPSSGSKVLVNSAFEVDYTRVSPVAIDDTDIIGGAEDNGDFTGLNVFFDARAKVFAQPRILCAPGFTHTKADSVTRNPVGAALEAVSERLRAAVVLDCPNASKEEAVAYRADYGDPRFMAYYPWVKVAVPNSNGTILTVPPSAHIAGVISATDNDNEKGFWWSPSNQQVNGILGLSKPIDFSVGDKNTVANYLNENRVSTIVYSDGFKSWGNRACDGGFLCVKRTEDFICDSIVAAHMWALDKPITRGYVQSVVAGVNEYLRRLKNTGAILGGEAYADPGINTAEIIANGELYIDFDWTPTYPAEHLKFRAHLVNDYISEIFAL